MKSISPYTNNQGPTFLCNVPAAISWTGLRLPTQSLGTRDEREAKQICIDLETILSDKENSTQDPTSSRFSVFHPRAVKIAFGLKADPVFRTSTVEVSAAQIETVGVIASKHKDLLAIAKQNGANLRVQLNSEQLDNALKEIQTLKREKADVEAELAEALKELKAFKKLHNVDVTETMKQALPKFLDYQQAKGLSSGTIRDCKRFCGELAELMDSKTLPEIGAGEIDSYVVTLTKGQRKKGKASISTFWTWARKQYQLTVNPMELTDSVKKAADKEPEALKDEKLLLRYLDAHKAELYWHCWVSMACLGAYSWQDLAGMKWKNIDKDLLECRFVREKNGKHRTSPIEKTYLKPLLKKYLAQLDKEQPLLFPSLSENGGKWNHGTWYSYYVKDRNGYRTSVKERLQKDADGLPWSYGPDEWRHQGATTMGHCGMNELQISSIMGNDPDICRKHYIANIGVKEWAFKYK